MLQVGLALLLCSVALLAEPMIRVKGLVRDSATHQPVAGAKVTIRAGQSVGGGGLRIGDSGEMRVVSEMITDATGQFQVGLQMSGYLFSAKADGYLDPGPFSGTSMNPRAYIPPRLNRTEDDSVEMVLELDKAGTVSGQLVAPSDGGKLGAMQVHLWERRGFQGTIMPFPVHRADADSEGRFRIEAKPGRYTLVAVPTSLFKNRFREEPGEAETKLASEFPILWYTAEELQSAPSFTLQSRQDLPLGSIAVPARSLSSVTVSTKEGTCRKGEEVSYEASELFSAPSTSAVLSVIRGKAGCGSRVIFDRLTPGRYTVTARVSGTPARAGSILVTVGGGMQKAEVSLGPIVAVRVQMKLPGDASQSAREGAGMQHVAARLDLEGVSTRASSLAVRAFNEEGTLESGALWNGRWQLTLLGSARGYVAERILYNGIPQPDFSFSLDASAPQQEVVVEMVSSQGEIKGSVSGMGVDRHARVFALRLPTDQRGAFYSLFQTVTDERGAFRYRAGRLRQGRYLLLAVSGPEQELEEPGALERVMGQGKEVELKDGVVDVGSLEVVKP